MREILIVGAYCDTEVKLQALENLLSQAKVLQMPVLIFGRYPLPEKVQRLCDYWIFDKSNPIIHDHAIIHWQRAHNKIVSNLFLDYGFAALDQMTKSLGFVNSLNYDIAYWVVYDVDLEAFVNFRKESRSLIEADQAQVVGFNFKPSSQGPLRGVGTTTLAFKVNESYSRLKGSMTESFYRKIISTDQNLLAEDVLMECLEINELKYHILDQSLNPPATLTATGIRKHGDVPDLFPKSHLNFGNCFIGRDENINQIAVFIWNIRNQNSEIEFDFGNHVEIVQTAGLDRIEFTLEQVPLYCRVASINGEIVDEILDPKYSDSYWNLNLIRLA